MKTIPIYNVKIGHHHVEEGSNSNEIHSYLLVGMGIILVQEVEYK